MRVHTGEQPCKCTFPGCDYATSQTTHLTAHMRTLIWHSDHSLGTKCAVTLQILMQDLQILVLALGPVQPKTRASVYAVRTL